MTYKFIPARDNELQDLLDRVSVEQLVYNVVARTVALGIALASGLTEGPEVANLDEGIAYAREGLEQGINGMLAEMRPAAEFTDTEIQAKPEILEAIRNGEDLASVDFDSLFDSGDEN